MSTTKNQRIAFYICFAILMLGLGCNDAVRGVFAPIFRDHFGLNATLVSMVVTVSYIGNLVFMLIGSRLSDALGIRKVFLLAIGLWGLALLAYLVTDSFPVLLVGVFFAMGASTLMNMLMNIMTPELFLAPGTVINTLFFVQEIGTTFTQSVISANAKGFADWKIVNGVLLGIAVVSGVLFYVLNRGRKEDAGRAEEKEVSAVSDEAAGGKGGVSYAFLMKQPAFWLFVLIFGFYFIGEHGVMNWMNIYCQDALGMSAGEAAVFPSLFFGGMMVGRLCLAPLVTKLGIRRALELFLGIGTVLYCISFAGGHFLYLLLPAGLCISIIYPTMTMCIQLYFAKEVTTTASGTIMAIGTVFDIVFNACFGRVIDGIGYGAGMLFLPFSMAVCLVLYTVLNMKVKTVRQLQ